MKTWTVGWGTLDHAAFLAKEGQAIDNGVEVVEKAVMDGHIAFLERRADFYRRQHEALVRLLENPPINVLTVIECMEGRNPETVIARAVGAAFIDEFERNQSGS